MLLHNLDPKMDTVSNIKGELTHILNKAAKDLNLDSFSINVNIDAQKGDGFLGEIYKASILDKKTNNKINIVIKRAPSDKNRRNETCIEDAYENEIHFYTRVLPYFRKFQQDYKISDVFNSVPKYITSISEPGKEMIVFEDITFLGYQIREKNFILDEEHAKFIFETYGKFHALSFCLKEQRPEEYRNLTKPFHNIFQQFINKRGFPRALNQAAQHCLDVLSKRGDEAIIKKFKIYSDQTIEMFSNCINYHGNYSTILHGDCWSNNVMFKYQNAEEATNLEDINLLDFQLTWIGTPVYDLSYFFYSGGCQELFKNLDHYLDLYYQSFSEFSNKFGNNPEKLLPRDTLTKEWKMYAKFGMFMSIILIKVKMLTKEQSIEMAESIGGNKGGKLLTASIKQDIFNERVRDLLVHLYEIDAL